MDIVLAKCSQCNAPLNIDPSKEKIICEYCGSTFIHKSVVNAKNTSKSTEIEQFKKPYIIKIKRKKKLLDGIAVIYEFKYNNTIIPLKNGEEISIETSVKNIDFDVVQRTNINSDTPFYGHMLGTADGTPIEIEIAVGSNFNQFSVNLISSTNKSICFKEKTYLD